MIYKNECFTTKWKFLAPEEVKGFNGPPPMFIMKPNLKFFLGFSELFWLYRLRECSKSDFALS